MSPSVRVPYSIVVVLVLIVVGGLWWGRTKDMDFMTPTGRIGPLPDFVSRPYDADPPSDLPESVARVADAGDTARPTITDPGKNAIEFGDLEASPGLAEYSEHAKKGAAFMGRLATTLETHGEYQRALLAWERVIDSCEATRAEFQEAGDALDRLRPILPNWNIDPEGDLTVLLQFGSTRQPDDTFSRAARDVAGFLRTDSGDIVAVVPRITASSFPDAPPQSPIAIYFSGPHATESAQSTVLSINPAPDDPAAIRRDILQKVYRLVQSQIATLDGITVPQAPTFPEEPGRDFQRRITRLQWQYFADALSRPVAPPPVAVPVDEDSAPDPDATEDSPPPPAVVVDPE